MSSYWITRAAPVAQVAYAAASITATYSLAGSFSVPVIFGFIISTLDAPVQVSFDGTTDHIAIPPGDTTPAVIPLNFKDNMSILPPSSIFVKEIGNPTTGSLYVCAFTSQIP